MPLFGDYPDTDTKNKETCLGLYASGIVSTKTICDLIGIDFTCMIPEPLEKEKIEPIIPIIEDFDKMLPEWKLDQALYSYNFEITTIGDEVKTYLKNGKVVTEDELNKPEVKDKNSPLTDTEYNPILEIEDEKK